MRRCTPVAMGAAITCGRWIARPTRFPGPPRHGQSRERAAPERTSGVDYDTEWTRRYPARLVRAVLLDNVTRPLAHAMASPEVAGRRDARAGRDARHLRGQPRQPRRHRAAVVGPAPAVPAQDGGGGGRRLLLRPALEGPSVGPRLWRPSPSSAQRSTGSRPRHGRPLIEEGWNLIIFPEGGRSPDGWFQEFRGGAAYLARRTGRPVVPVHIEGTRRILPKDGGRLRRSPTRSPSGRPCRPSRARTPGASGHASKRPWQPWPTRPGPTGGRPAGGRRPARRRRPGALRRAVAAGMGARPRARRCRQRRTTVGDPSPLNRRAAESQSG